MLHSALNYAMLVKPAHFCDLAMLENEGTTHVKSFVSSFVGDKVFIKKNNEQDIAMVT